jgi:biopolymer transport protein ExbD
MSGGGELGAPETRRKGKKKKVRRLGIRIDMTPLVDIAFLLLTFFMLTTSMSRPQTMEINLPPDDKVKVEIAESNLLTLRINEKGDIYWNVGIEKPQKVERANLTAFLKERSQTNPKLVVLLKFDRAGKYSNMVNIIDELNLASISRFSIGHMDDADKALLAKAMS